MLQKRYKPCLYNALQFIHSFEHLAPLKHEFVLTVDFTHAAIFQVSMTDAEVVAIDVNETMHPVNAIFHPLHRNLIYSDAMYREIRQLSLSGNSSVSLTNTGT